MPDYSDIRRLAERIRPYIQEVSSQEARRHVLSGALLIDVRDEEELMVNPPLAGAIHMSRGRLEYLITDAVEHRDDPIVIYCGGGNRGALAAASLRQLGYTAVYNVRGGLRAWRSSNDQLWIDCPRDVQTVEQRHASN